MMRKESDIPTNFGINYYEKIKVNTTKIHVNIQQLRLIKNCIISWCLQQLNKYIFISLDSILKCYISDAMKYNVTYLKNLAKLIENFILIEAIICC